MAGDHEIDWGAAPPKGYWRNSRGDLVHEANIRPLERDMDAVVRKIHAFGGALSAQMWRFRAHTLDDIYGLTARAVEQYGGKRPGGRKGGVTLATYDGCHRVVLAQADRIGVGPEILAAQALVEECLDEWAAQCNLKLRALVEQSFRPDATGQVSVAQLLRLRRIHIDDPRWRQLQAAIGDALRPEGKAEYIRLYERATPADPWVPVPLHLATVRRPDDDASSDPVEILRRRALAAIDEARHAGLGEGLILETLRAAKRKIPAPETAE